MTWLLVVFLSGTVQESVYFSNLDTCLRIAEKIRAQNLDPSLAGDSRIWVKAYCVPKSVPQKEGEKK
tara:strand:- start:437 stop:637 length:201 start_codon:yes stop_codon:yes gene_type:complete